LYCIITYKSAVISAQLISDVHYTVFIVSPYAVYIS